METKRQISTLKSYTSFLEVLSFYYYISLATRQRENRISYKYGIRNGKEENKIWHQSWVWWHKHTHSHTSTPEAEEKDCSRPIWVTQQDPVSKKQTNKPTNKHKTKNNLH
jgi:hypothetical protein